MTIERQETKLCEKRRPQDKIYRRIWEENGVERSTGKRIGLKEGKEDWTEGRERGVERMTEKDIRKEDLKRDWKDGLEKRLERRT